MKAPDTLSRDMLAHTVSRSLFDRIVCGIDTTPASFHAALQAGRLRSPGGTLTLVAVAEPRFSPSAALATGELRPNTARELSKALDRTLAGAPEAEARLLEGEAVTTLLAEARRENATLLAVGTHGLPRSTGVALGSVATAALHRSPCSTLIARPSGSTEQFPGSIAVGIDGSPHSAAAAAVAFELSGRFGSEVRPIAARGGDVDIAAVRRIVGAPAVEDGGPLDVLFRASATSDLLILGSRGLQGVRALGSVSERVAHIALCSVLVVRLP